MDKTSEKVLKFLIDHNDQKLYCFAFVNGADQNISQLMKIPVEHLHRCISYLVHEGYLNYTYTGYQGTGFILTHTALHYKEFKKIKCIEFIVTSIIVPIIVSIATTILTILVTDWL